MSGQSKTPERVSLETSQKTCADCGTTKTPLWRGGPAGPKVSRSSFNQLILDCALSHIIVMFYFSR